MIARMENLSARSNGMVNAIAQRFEAIDPAQAAEIESFSEEQKRLLQNMKRLVRG